MKQPEHDHAWEHLTDISVLNFASKEVFYFEESQEDVRVAKGHQTEGQECWEASIEDGGALNDY